MELVEISEGKVDVTVPDFKESEGPKGIGEGVFYNPSMEKHRDIFISFLNAFNSSADKKTISLLDGMAATGIRGIRVAKESSVKDITMNDISKKATDLIEKNSEKNSIQADITNESFEEHLLDNRYKYDYIDIDPFGSPAPYYPIAARCVSHEGVVGVTATDTAVLCGTYPKTSLRRYSSRPKNNWCRHENGLRILIAYCAREAARHDKWVKPLLSYYEGHHFRTYLQIGDGAKKADSCIEKVRRVSFGNGDWKKEGLTVEDSCGPFWTGELFAQDILESMNPVGTMDGELLSSWKKESGKPPFFYDTNKISSVLGVAPPPIDDIIEKLDERRFKSSRTHFSPTGVKSEASYGVIKEIFGELSSD